MATEIIAFTGSGGREDAFAKHCAEDPDVAGVLVIPGNDFIPFHIGSKCIDHPSFRSVSKTDFGTMLKIFEDYGVTRIHACQDDVVASGFVNEARKRGFNTIGPTKEAGKIEWWKPDARMLAEEAGLLQPRFTVWDSQEEAISQLDKTLSYLNEGTGDELCWIKAAGLAEGKGAIGARTKEEAIQAIRIMSDFKAAGATFLIEEWLRNDDGTPGQEFSYFVYCDGEEFIYYGSAVDQKRVNNRDQGPNTGSMGGNDEPHFLDEGFKRQVERDAIAPLLKKLAEQGRPYTGILYYSGMRLICGGEVVSKMVECNCRGGDPETQLIVPGITTPSLKIPRHLAAGGKLGDIKIEHDGQRRVAVTMASLGYPGDYSKVKGAEVLGIEEAMGLVGVEVYGAGMKREGGRFVASGGRLLYVVGSGPNILEARKNAYSGVSLIAVGDNLHHHRDDIALEEYLHFLRNQK